MFNYMNGIIMNIAFDKCRQELLAQNKTEAFEYMDKNLASFITGSILSVSNLSSLLSLIFSQCLIYPPSYL